MPYAQNNNVTIIACSPLGGTKGNNLRDLSPELSQTINTIAKNRKISFHQVALAWLVSNPNVQAIPKAANIKHKAECAVVGDIILTLQEFSEINDKLILG